MRIGVGDCQAVATIGEALDHHVCSCVVVGAEHGTQLSPVQRARVIRLTGFPKGCGRRRECASVPGTCPLRRPQNRPRLRPPLPGWSSWCSMLLFRTSVGGKTCTVDLRVLSPPDKAEVPGRVRLRLGRVLRVRGRQSLAPVIPDRGWGYRWGQEWRNPLPSSFFGGPRGARRPSHLRQSTGAEDAGRRGRSAPRNSAVQIFGLRTILILKFDSGDRQRAFLSNLSSRGLQAVTSAVNAST